MRRADMDAEEEMPGVYVYRAGSSDPFEMYVSGERKRREESE